MKVSQKSHKRLSIVSQKSHKSLPKVSQKSLKSVSKVSQKSLKSLSKVSQKSLNWNQKSDRLTQWQGHLLSCPGQVKRLQKWVAALLAGFISEPRMCLNMSWIYSCWLEKNIQTSRSPLNWNICVFSVTINISTTGGFRVGFLQPDTNHP